MINRNVLDLEARVTIQVEEELKVDNSYLDDDNLPPGYVDYDLVSLNIESGILIIETKGEIIKIELSEEQCKKIIDSL